MKRYPLYTPPYFRRHHSVSGPYLASSHSKSPSQAGSLRLPDSCHCRCTCTYQPSNLPTTGEPALSKSEVMHIARKRRQDDNKENEAAAFDLSPPKKKPRLYAKRRSIKQKLEDIFDEINDANWGISDFLYYAFRNKDSEGNDVHRDQSHGNIVQGFLAGHTRYTPAYIINFWFCHQDGRLDQNSALMYSTTVPYTEIKPVRPCLTSFAVQIVERRLVQEAGNAVKPLSGLHAVASRKSALKTAQWVDIGATTVPEVGDVLKALQPLTWHYLTKIAARKPRVRRGVVQLRKRRPVEAVST